MVPPDAAAAIAAAARLEGLDKGRIRAGIAATGHPLMPLITELTRVVGEDYGGWVHWGATTQNITQTGDALLLRDAHRRLLALLALLAGSGGKIGRELYSLMQTEYGEVLEPAAPGDVGLIVSEAVMLALGKVIGRQEAHSVVSEAAHRAAAGESTFAGLLESDPRVTTYLTAGDLVALLDPTRHLGLSAPLARAGAGRARAAVQDIGSDQGSWDVSPAASTSACTSVISSP
ncbi:hypothetical protein [Dactylosporangium sp. NPDC049140]|uniref:hypothetical protein n=1 Tax=Dactylosporangium sp. NPDC049140 TaxID=3155647 RepID=UPI0033C2E801